LKLGGFTCVFAEITDGMSLKPAFRWSGKRFQKSIYTLQRESQDVFPAFFRQILRLMKIWTLSRPASLGTALPPR
jgi:hypothetical protein